MAAPTATDLLAQECRAARRLGRLFRLERVGGFGRRSLETVQRLVRRRSTLVAELVRLEDERRACSAPLTPELRRAVTDLAGEIEPALNSAEQRVARLRAELRMVGGEGSPSGVRSTGGGRLIGRG